MRRRRIGSWTLTTALVISATACFSEESRDFTFATEHSTHETLANFYSQGRAIGACRAAFQVIVENVERLPPNSSIVWGPDYDRCGSCVNNVRCVPKSLYPDLWDRLEKAAASRKLTISSTYPGPQILSLEAEPPSFPKVVVADSVKPGEFDAVLHWNVADQIPQDDATRDEHRAYNGRSHDFHASGKQLSGYECELFFGTLPTQSRVLIQLAVAPSLARDPMPQPLKETIRCIHDAWRRDLAKAVRLGKIEVTIAADKRVSDALANFAATELPAVRIDWSNYRGPDAPHEEVLYLIDGVYVGRGDQGFERTLRKLKSVPPGCSIEFPRFEYGGRMFYENFGLDRIEAENLSLRSAFPFSHRKAEVRAIFKERELRAAWSPRLLNALPARTVFDWGNGDRYGRVFATKGRIVFHDEAIGVAAVRVSWKAFHPFQGEHRPLESEAIYTLNENEVGAGVPGFAKIMDRLATLPENAVVQVRVCLRTRGSFRCPITFEERRHFERTGFEPYFGLFPWLIQVAEERKLMLEWIPDQGGSCQDCSLFR